MAYSLSISIHPSSPSVLLSQRCSPRIAVRCHLQVPAIILFPIALKLLQIPLSKLFFYPNSTVQSSTTAYQSIFCRGRTRPPSLFFLVLPVCCQSFGYPSILQLQYPASITILCSSSIPASSSEPLIPSVPPLGGCFSFDPSKPSSQHPPPPKLLFIQSTIPTRVLARFQLLDVCLVFFLEIRPQWCLSCRLV